MEAKLEISNLLTPFINGAIALNSEVKNLLDIGLSDYLYSQTEKYYYVNTFLHRAEKVKFRDIYYPITTQYKKLETRFDNVADIFENYKRIVIVGSAGCGKSTLIKHIFLNSLSTSFKIPILIELRSLNDYKGDFESLLTQKVLKTQLKPSENIFRRALKDGRFLFLLDGYDEIFSERKQEINRQIELFIDSYPENAFLITTRPGGGIEAFPRFHNFVVKDLNLKEVKNFITKMVDNDERKNRIFNVIDDASNSSYLEYLKNPLLLSMFILAFESHPEIPSKKSAFYRNVFDTLYSKHDGITKNSFPREKLTQLKREEFEEFLCIFSFISLSEGIYAFTQEYLQDTFKKVKKHLHLDVDSEHLIYDLRTAISVLLLDGFEYRFPHRSMQEYFAAHFINSLPSEKKSKAYDNMAGVWDAASLDGSFNFWNLCSELDKVSFYKFFILPRMKNMSKQLATKNDRDMLKAYSKLIEPAFYYQEEVTSYAKKELPKVLGIYREANTTSAMMDFFNVYDYDDFFFFPSLSGAQDELLPLYENRSTKWSDEKFFLSAPVIDILLKHRITDVIKKYKRLIDAKIQSLESELDKENRSLDGILGGN